MPQTAVLPALSVEESKRKSELVAIVKRGLDWMETDGLKAWNAALELRESRLYRDSHDNWESFCKDVFGREKRRIDQLIKGAEVVKNIETTNGKVGNLGSQLTPNTERQTRELAKAPLEQQAEVWEEAVELAGGEQPTAKQVKAAVENAKEPEPEILRDPLGIPMPAYLLPVFNGLALFREADSLCRQLQDVIEKLSMNPAGATFRRELETAGKSEATIKHRHKSLQQIKTDLKLSRPYTRCPYCASRESGKAFKDCKQCRGAGWATKMTFDSAPEDYRKAVEKSK